MSTAAEQVKQDLTAAMKAQDKERVSVLRMALSELQKAAKEGGPDEQAVLRRERKRRLEAATQFRDGGREDLAEAEEAEAEVLSAYLPEDLPEEALRDIVRDVIAETGATSAKDMGAVMQLAMPRVAGRADGRRVSAVVKQALG